VLRRYLQEIVGATLLDDIAMVPRQEVLSLEPAEAAMILALLEAGGELNRQEIVRRSAPQVRSVKATERLLRRSLLIIPTDRRRVHLFGHPRGVSRTGSAAGLTRPAATPLSPTAAS
jgi:hypothetical protein